MPRVSREQADLHRSAIEQASSRLFRERGIKGVSVADLMADVGLTHGGFYGHFESKDELAAVACAHAFGQSAGRWRKRADAHGEPAQARASLIDGYLSPQSCKAVGRSCPAPALAIDVSREPDGAPVRAAYAAGVDELVTILATMEHAGSDEADRAMAVADFATLVGALVLARATAGHALSAEFLAASRKRLLSSATSADATAAAPI